MKILKNKLLESGYSEDLVFDIFQYQYQYNSIYANFVNSLGVNITSVTSIEKIPFLPIDFFKNHIIKSSIDDPKFTFISSGTTYKSRSKYLLFDDEFYNLVSKRIFESIYGQLEDYHILAFLPSYKENPNSSLIFMINNFMRNAGSGYYVDFCDFPISQKSKTILIGVSYAFLDLSESSTFDFSDMIIIETGGMKGRRKELLRSELHNKLQESFNVRTIHSEYGMTEMLSQSYSIGQGIFEESFSMRVLIRDMNDPLSLEPIGRVGGINVIDLANIDTCSFIATQDVGRKLSDNQFEVLGRLDNSDIRGCNLMYV